MFSCEILAHSIPEWAVDYNQGQQYELITYKLSYPRFINSELLTHSTGSVNSASSRAIPATKMIESIINNPFVPLAFQKEHSGMQGREYHTDPDTIKTLTENWLLHRDEAVKAAEYMKINQVTKQLANRLLEPFAWHQIIFTIPCGKGQLQNLFDLRCPEYVIDGVKYRSKSEAIETHPELAEKDLFFWLLSNEGSAEIHFATIAELMYDAYRKSTPTPIQPKDWHMPFADQIDPSLDLETKLKVIVARCARISYQTFGSNPKIDYEKDLELFDYLVNNGHMSPLQHVGMTMSKKQVGQFLRCYPDDLSGIGIPNSEYGWAYKMRGFIPYRFIIEKQMKI